MSRREFTTATMEDAYMRAGGICECYLCPQLERPLGCGTRLTLGNIRYEHIWQDAITGDNSLENCAVLCKTCWKEKTYQVDLPAVARANRQRRLGRGIRKARRAWPRR